MNEAHHLIKLATFARTSAAGEGQKVDKISEVITYLRNVRNAGRVLVGEEKGGG